jgi:DNA-binding GntR family transcriptional regulator
MLHFERQGNAQHTCRQHLRILERIMAQDAAGARDAMQGNIEEGRNDIRTTIKDALARAYLTRKPASES